MKFTDDKTSRIVIPESLLPLDRLPGPIDGSRTVVSPALVLDLPLQVLPTISGSVMAWPHLGRVES